MGPADLTLLLSAVSAGDKGALSKLLPFVYKELRRHAGYLMKHERPGHTLQPTALVHEAFVRLFGRQHIGWKDRAHFFAAASHLMRHILVDHARTRGRKKRGSGAPHVTFTERTGLSVRNDEDVLAVNELLDRLAAIDTRQAEIVSLRFFGGLSVEEVALVLGLSKRTVEDEWSITRAWLRRELGGS